MFPYFYFDLTYLLFLAPAMILAFIAQAWIRSAYASGMQQRAKMTGAQAARHILDQNGLHDIPIEESPGQMSDHYSPQERVVRLSTEVYRTPSLTAVGIAAHEVGHALQHAFGYLPLQLRNIAVPLANFGSPIGMLLLFVGIGFGMTPFGKMLAWAGVLLFSGVVMFQLVNLPVEFNASTRAKQQLVQLGIVDTYEMGPVRSVLTAAALTYVAAALQSLMQLMYFLMILTGGSRSRE
jgi:Zn-dependent membrane protease YugP